VNTRTFGTYLIALAIAFGVLGGGLILYQKHNPAGLSREASQLRRLVADEAKPYEARLDARHKLDEMYAADKATPPLANYALLAGAVMLLLGAGIRIASSTDNKASSPGPSFTGEIARLTELRDRGDLSPAEFDQAKARILRS
jgi:hypothetical protein